MLNSVIKKNPLLHTAKQKQAKFLVCPRAIVLIILGNPFLFGITCKTLRLISILIL